MLFWWVNHKQTFKVEVDEGYIWSPQKNNNGSTNQTYINLTKAQMGDVIFSYAGGKIAAVGKVTSPAEDKERPAEFGNTGQQWDKAGWLVPVRWIRLPVPLVPKSHLSEIAPLLPERNSHIRPDGNGNQSCYLAAIGQDLGFKVLNLIEENNDGTRVQLEDFENEIEEDAVQEVISHSDPSSTDVQQLILARKGQGVFKIKVGKIETKCRVTGLADKRLLIASHIKPWKDSTNLERLDGYNGFLLSPHVDRLFDRGWISFTVDGKLLISENKIKPVLQHWSIDINKNVGRFAERQMQYLEYHRNHIFKR